MATPHLIRTDNPDYDPNNQYGSEPAFLGSVALTNGGDTHLVTLAQSSAWTNKEFIATPKEGRWAACMATGIEAYPTQQGGVAVYNDTNSLVAAVKTCMDGLSWRTGYHPCINAFMRGRMAGPYSHRSGVAQDNSRAEYVHSAVAYRFDLKHLHFSKMSSYSAYLRVYCPSLLGNIIGGGLYDSSMSNLAMYNSASCLRCLLSPDLPQLAADVAEGHDSWEFYGNANNGTTVNSATRYYYHSVNYNPYHGDDCISMPVWTANARTASPSTTAPTMYYHDFQITDSGNVGVLGRNPGTVWVVLHFHRGNAFSDGGISGQWGLERNSSWCAWMYRADLRFLCTCAKF